MRRTRLSTFLTVASVLTCVACGGDDKDNGKPTLDSGVSLDSSTPPTSDASVANDAGASSDAGLIVEADCFQNPTTYLEIINACTDAEKVTKNPVLPLLMADGGLPPIP